MSYDPNAITSRQRSWSYWVIWIGAASALLLLCDLLFASGRSIPGPILGFAVGGLLVVAFYRRTDDYFRSLCVMGQRFLTVYMSALLFLIWTLREIYDEGETPSAFAALVYDGYFVAVSAAVVFYAGYAFAWLRDRF